MSTVGDKEMHRIGTERDAPADRSGHAELDWLGDWLREEESREGHGSVSAMQSAGRAMIQSAIQSTRCVCGAWFCVCFAECGGTMIRGPLCRV